MVSIFGFLLNGVCSVATLLRAVVWFGVLGFICASIFVFCFTELQEFSGRVEKKLTKKVVKTYGSRNILHRRMLSRHPAFPDFVTGSKKGVGTHFNCRVCQRDVARRSQGVGEFRRHFQSDAHWFKDVTYRVHMGLQVLNRLMEPMELSERQLADYKSRPFCDLGEEYPFPEDLVPKHSKPDSNVPFMTLVSCFCEFLAFAVMVATLIICVVCGAIFVRLWANGSRVFLCVGAVRRLWLVCCFSLFFSSFSFLSFFLCQFNFVVCSCGGGMMISSKLGVRSVVRILVVSLSRAGPSVGFFG